MGHEWQDYAAVLFDLDGVLTPTVDAHRRAWARLFGDLLAQAGVAPYTDEDYAQLVDGRTRYDGVRAVLESRGLVYVEGPRQLADAPGVLSVRELGDQKDAMFRAELATGITPYPGSLQFLIAAMARGLAVAVVSGSRNARNVLVAAGLDDVFGVVVDGIVASEIGLPGKPSPAMYLEAARRLGVAPEHAVVIEDALGGVAAAKAGGFGLVIGVDRGVGRDLLVTQGANFVVNDLAELLAGSEEST